MDSHKNTRTTAHSRAQIACRVHSAVPIATVARAFGICDRTVKKWAERALMTTLPLEDGSCRPHSSPTAISAGVVVEIERPRRLRRTGAEIPDILGVSPAPSPRPVGACGWCINGRARIRHAPTARRSASSARCSTNGPPRGRSRPRRNGPASCTTTQRASPTPGARRTTQISRLVHSDESADSSQLAASTSANPSSSVVAGVGFERTTFGL
jgi:transposase-like protein